MTLLMTVFFENSFSEHYFPNIDNKKAPVTIRPNVSGLDKDLVLDIEVWEGKWKLNATNAYSLIYSGNPADSVDLAGGVVIEGSESKTEAWFSVKIDEVNPDDMVFNKYLYHEDAGKTISIGSDEKCDIVFNDRFVTKEHATIYCDGTNSFVNDCNTVNGTFLNGKMVNGKTELHYGDIIYVVGLKIVFLGSLLAINNPRGAVTMNGINSVTIPKYDEEEQVEVEYEDVYFLRTPRKLLKLDTEELSLEKCPPKQDQKRQPLIFTIGPSFTMVIPMAIGAIFAAGSGSVGMGVGTIFISFGAAATGAIWAVVSNVYEKKQLTEAEKERKDKFIKYIKYSEDLLAKKADYNRSVLNQQYPSIEEILDYTRNTTSRLWEKSSTQEDFLSIRLGIGNILSPNKIEVAKEEVIGVHEPLNDNIYKLQNQFKILPNIPIAVSLYDYRMVGIVSADKEERNNIVRTISLQLAASYSYTEVKMCYVFPGAEIDEMEYTRWLPHVYTPDKRLRMIACDPLGLGDVMYFLSDVIRDRMEKSKEEQGKEEESKALPHYVIFIKDISMIVDETISKFLLNPPKEAGISVVFAADAIDKLPSNCTTIIQSQEGTGVCYNTLSAFEEISGVRFDQVSLSETDTFSRELSNFMVRENQANTSIPDKVTFLGMYKTNNVESLDIYHRWLDNRTYESMKSMVGIKSGGSPLYLDIHEKYHGPHGLVAGTTGSGKSETLQTYILSLAVNYHPHEVAFILIDYKGGGMARSFEGMPHLAGMITNLGGNQTTRALLSINAEIKRRQRIFNDYNVKHIDAYIELYRSGVAEEPMPHLIIIADEFAELKKEQPEFVRALVSAARVGRSLGVNLILATQKPSGTVDEEIWSNTRFRVCLRVADKQDSNEMLKRTDAAFITGTGRGFLQVGSDEIFEEFQSGWSGAPYTPEIPYTDEDSAKVQIVGLTGKPETVKKKKKAGSDNLKKTTQLDALVKYTAEIAKENDVAPLRQIWLEPLPKMLYLEDLEFENPDNQFIIPIGLCDDPQNQRQFTASLDFIRDGHLLICGAGGSGKTTLVQTILYQAAKSFDSTQVNFYIADFSSRTLTAFDKLPHTGCICMDGMDDKIDEMFEFLKVELEKRKRVFAENGMGSFRDYKQVYNNFPAILFVIDNYVGFSETYEQYEDLLIQMTREAASYGIYLILTCNNPGDIRSRMSQNITKGIGLQLVDRFDYDAILGMRAEITPDMGIQGRGMIRVDAPLEFQVALPIKGAGEGSTVLSLRKEIDRLAESSGGAKANAKKVGVKYDAFDFNSFAKSKEITSAPENILPIGKNVENGKMYGANLDKILCYSIAGEGKSGKTNLLKSMAMLAKKQDARVFIFDGILGELADFAKANKVDGYITNKEDLYKFMEDVLIPELTERNGMVYEAREGGKDVKAALKNKDRIVFLINSATEFFEAVYDAEMDMSEVVETVFEKGLEHKLHFIMTISPVEYQDCYSYAALRQFTKWNEGLFLGVGFADQVILDISSDEKSDNRPAGAAIASDGGKGVAIMTPLTE